MTHPNVLYIVHTYYTVPTSAKDLGRTGWVWQGLPGPDDGPQIGWGGGGGVLYEEMAYTQSPLKGKM